MGSDVMSIIVAAVIGLMAIVITIVIGGAAILITLKLHQMNTGLYQSLSSLSGDMNSTLASIKVATVDVLSPTMKEVLSMLRDKTQVRVNSIGEKYIQRIAESAERLQQTTDDKEKEALVQKIYADLSSFVGTVKHDIAVELSPDDLVKDRMSLDASIPGAIAYDWIPFVRRIRALEKGNKFLSVKWLRETKFADDTKAQEELQTAIDRNMLEIYFIENPRNPKYPVSCCRLNKEHPTVRQILESLE